MRFFYLFILIFFFQKYCHYLISFACIRRKKHSFVSTKKPKQQIPSEANRTQPTRWGKPDSRYIIQHTTRDSLPSFVLLFNPLWLATATCSMGDRNWELSVLVCAGCEGEAVGPLAHKVQKKRQKNGQKNKALEYKYNIQYRSACVGHITHT